jgi:hypothetical protein
MSNGKLTFTIGGREALPVRAIPYLAGRRYSPDNVAQSFAKVQPPAPFPALLQNLTAYHIPDDTPAEVMPRDWDRVLAELQGFEHRLRDIHPNISIDDDDAGYAEWCRDAPGYLPQAFVWFDEFEREFKADWARVLHVDIRDGDEQLNLRPILDDSTRAMVLAGFGPRKLHAANNPQDEATKREHLVGGYDYTMKAAMWLKRASVKPDEAAMLLCRIDPLSEKDPERIYVDDDKASPDRYRQLLRVFLDVAETVPKQRTLIDWRDVATREGLRHHKWIDEYVQARIEESPVNSASGGGAPKVDAGATAEKDAAPKKPDSEPPSHKCAVFRAMPKLNPSKVTIKFVAGDTGVEALIVAAGNETLELALADLDLYDYHRKKMNKQGEALIVMAKKGYLPYTLKDVARMSKVRKSIKRHLGILSDPFSFEGTGQTRKWVPLFNVSDKRNAAAERDKREGEGREVSAESEAILLDPESHTAEEVQQATKDKARSFRWKSKGFKLDEQAARKAAKEVLKDLEPDWKDGLTPPELQASTNDLGKKILDKVKLDWGRDLDQDGKNDAIQDALAIFIEVGDSFS